MDLFFNASYVAFLKNFAAKADIRYYLQGIYFEKFHYKRPGYDALLEGAIGLATDGHQLAAIIDTYGWVRQPTLISLDAGATAQCRAKSRTGFGHLPKVVIVRGQRLSIEYQSAPCKDVVETINPNALEAYIQPGECLIEGVFPAWRRVLPDIAALEPGAPDCYAGALIQKAVMAARVLDDSKRYNGVRLWRVKGESHKPIVLQYDSHPNALTLVMPMRGDTDGQGTPKLWNYLK